LATFTTNDSKETCHYFVDLEGSDVNGHNDKKDNKSNGGCSWNNNSPEVGSNLGSNHQIQQVHTPPNVFTTTTINSHTQNNNPRPPISQFLVLFEIKVSRPQQ